MKKTLLASLTINECLKYTLRSQFIQLMYPPPSLSFDEILLEKMLKPSNQGLKIPGSVASCHTSLTE